MKAKYQEEGNQFTSTLDDKYRKPSRYDSTNVRDGDGEIIDHGHWIRTTEKLPRVVEEIKPHPMAYIWVNSRECSKRQMKGS